MVRHASYYFVPGLKGSELAQCLPIEPPCVKYFGSATEVEGSDGIKFKLDEGYRVSIVVRESVTLRVFDK